jgi:hypothetical protein
VPGVVLLFRFEGFFLDGVGVCTGGVTGATETPLAPLAPVEPLFWAATRASRMLFTETMKSCQISAG